jgi:hypothetical protein
MESESVPTRTLASYDEVEVEIEDVEEQGEVEELTKTLRLRTHNPSVVSRPSCRS